MIRQKSFAKKEGKKSDNSERFEFIRRRIRIERKQSSDFMGRKELENGYIEATVGKGIISGSAAYATGSTEGEMVVTDSFHKLRAMSSSIARLERYVVLQVKLEPIK